jgi:glutamyl-Q tRNA(Asp) synthetase
LPTPIYLHTPLVLDVRGEKLSKSNGAAALDVSAPMRVLGEAALVLELRVTRRADHETWLRDAMAAWRERWG